MTFSAGAHVVAEVGDEVFLVDPSDGGAYRLDGSGPRMWDLLSSGASIADAAGTVASETRASAERVEADMARLAAQLVEIGALSAIDPT